ncbi:MAG TPA: MlaD family protein [Polyangiaceae bacterium LLY-WYZ-14_1]|nr:MlaD family protein [Polyangiaceae bacterium LLY-WYZ-14_1]
MSGPASQSRYVFVGLFVFTTIALTLAGIVVLGGRTLYEKTTVVETYFRSTVQGLDIGAPVTFRGVKIGTVKEIGVAFQFYELPNWEEQVHPADLIVVRMALVDERGLSLGDSVGSFVDQGLRVRLEQQGLTGVAYIEADFVEASEPSQIDVPWEPDYPYVPSTVGGLASLEATAERILEGLEDADVETVAQHLDELILAVTTVVRKVDVTVDTVQREADAVDLEALQREAELLMAQLRRTAATLEAQAAEVDVARLSASAIQTLDAATQTLRSAEAAVVEASGVVENGQYDLIASLDNLRATTENLRQLTDLVRQQPSLLLRSDAPEPTGPDEVEVYE